MEGEVCFGMPGPRVDEPSELKVAESGGLEEGVGAVLVWSRVGKSDWRSKTTLVRVISEYEGALMDNFGDLLLKL
jgi:hypothetical protein